MDKKVQYHLNCPNCGNPDAEFVSQTGRTNEGENESYICNLCSGKESTIPSRI